MIVIRVFLFASTRREIHILAAYQKFMNKHCGKRRSSSRPHSSRVLAWLSQRRPTKLLISLLFSFSELVTSLSETFAPHPSFYNSFI